MRLRICIVSEAIKSPFDEGVKIFVYNFIRELSKNYTILAIGRSNEYRGEIKEFCVKALPENKLFISKYLKKKIRKFEPDLIYYLPTAHATIYAFIRAKILKLYGNGAKTIFITLQPRKYSTIKKRIIPFIAPDLVLVQSLKTLKILENLGCKVKRIKAGVNLEKFIPASENKKRELRKKYGIPLDKYIVLHVGHINKNRNMQFLQKIQPLENMQAVAIGSTSYPEDDELVQILKTKGIIVISNYVKDIEEIYQSADCYLFPVFSDGASIEIPLSVFEAMACNLPIVTTKFGGLPNLVEEQDDFVYFDTMDEIIPKLKLIRRISCPKTRNLVERYSWENVFKQVLSNSLT